MNRDILKTRVLQALKDNPSLKLRRDNAELYELAGAETVAEKTFVRSVKMKFAKGLLDESGNPRPRKTGQPREEELSPASQASVFKVSGRGDLSDKVVEYFKANPHKLEERSNAELYAAVGADDSSKQNTTRGIKSKLKKAVKASGIGVVAVEMRKDAVEPMAEFEEELETIQVILTEKQRRAAELFHAGNTKTDAVMEAYGVSYEDANSNCSKVFQTEGVKRYLSYLREKSAVKAVRLHEEMLDLRVRIAHSADIDHFVKWKKGGQISIKSVVDRKRLVGIRSMKISQEAVENVPLPDKEGKLRDDPGKLVKSSITLRLRDAEGAARHLNKDLASIINGLGGDSLDPEISELWERFIKKDAENSLSAIDFAHELSFRGRPIPESVKLQANYELAKKLQEGDMDTDPLFKDGEAEPDDFDFDNLDVQRKQSEKLTAFLDNYQQQIEDFVPKREEEIKEIKAKHGYDKQKKPTGEIIEGDDSPLDADAFDDGTSDPFDAG